VLVPASLSELEREDGQRVEELVQENDAGTGLRLLWLFILHQLLGHLHLLHQVVVVHLGEAVEPVQTDLVFLINKLVNAALAL